MTALVWMVGLSVGSWLVVTAAAGAANPEAVFGMAGPLVAACASWVAITSLDDSSGETGKNFGCAFSGAPRNSDQRFSSVRR